VRGSIRTAKLYTTRRSPGRGEGCGQVCLLTSLRREGAEVTMDQDTLLDLFRRSGALLEGHFRLSSGLHSPGYLQCALVLQHPEHAAALGTALGDQVRGLRATVVLSPALGGLIIGHEVARAIGARAIFAERADGVLTLRRGFVLGEADHVLVVEDVVTTGGSTRETMQVARAAGAHVVAVAAVVDRSGGAAALDVPLHALMSIALPTYEPDRCPLCAQGLAIAKPGSRPLPAREGDVG
jgi:orotate phosphoribosyltransferase